MTPRKEYDLGQEPRKIHTNVTRETEHHVYKTNVDCAQACIDILGHEHPLVEYFEKHAP